MGFSTAGFEVGLATGRLLLASGAGRKASAVTGSARILVRAPVPAFVLGAGLVVGFGAGFDVGFGVGLGAAGFGVGFGVGLGAAGFGVGARTGLAVVGTVTTWATTGTRVAGCGVGAAANGAGVGC